MKTKDIEWVGKGMSVRNYVKSLFIASKYNDIWTIFRLAINNLKLLKGGDWSGRICREIKRIKV